MESPEIVRLLSQRPTALPRPARRFLELLVQNQGLLERMHLCRPEERGQVRHSVWISTEIGCWAVLLGNDPEGGAQAARDRSRLALEGLDLSPAEVVERLQAVPVWFLALDSQVDLPPAGEAARLERTLHRLGRLDRQGVRRRALLDQIDAALDAGDLSGAAQLRRLLA